MGVMFAGENVAIRSAQGINDHRQLRLDIKRKGFPMAGANVHEFTDNNFQGEVLQAELPVLVDFWAPWCPPCRQIAPMIDQLAAENLGSIKVGKVNLDECPTVSQEYGVESIPTLMVFKGGQVVSRYVGAQPKSRMQTALDAAKA